MCQPDLLISGIIFIYRLGALILTLSELECRFLKNSNKLPVQGGTLLNSINEQVFHFKDETYKTIMHQGLLSYTDFHFLLLLMSTPTRYLDIIFRGFDISADGNVEAKVIRNDDANYHNSRLSNNAIEIAPIIEG